MSPGLSRSDSVSRFNGGRGLLKLYGVSLACFVLVGAIVLNL